MKPFAFLAILASAVAAMILSSCAMKLGADGSKEVTIDGQGAATAAYALGKVIADKP